MPEPNSAQFQPVKRSMLPWILLGVAVLVLILVIVVFLNFGFLFTGDL